MPKKFCLKFFLLISAYPNQKYFHGPWLNSFWKHVQYAISNIIYFIDKLVFLLLFQLPKSKPNIKMANNPPCITCTYVGSDPISQINLSAAPPNMKKRKWNASSGSTSNQNKSVTNHENNSSSTTNSNASGEDLSVWHKNCDKPVSIRLRTNNLGQNQDLALKDEQLPRPKYVFSKTDWTHDQDQALEQLLMK